jgi:hypothetical protein
MYGAKACLAKLMAEAREEIEAYERGERPDLRVVTYYTHADGTVEREDKNGTTSYGRSSRRAPAKRNGSGPRSPERLKPPLGLP